MPFSLSLSYLSFFTLIPVPFFFPAPTKKKKKTLNPSGAREKEKEMVLFSFLVEELFSPFIFSPLKKKKKTSFFALHELPLGVYHFSLLSQIPIVPPSLGIFFGGAREKKIYKAPSTPLRTIRTYSLKSTIRVAIIYQCVVHSLCCLMLVTKRGVFHLRPLSQSSLSPRNPLSCSLSPSCGCDQNLYETFFPPRSFFKEKTNNNDKDLRKSQVSGKCSQKKKKKKNLRTCTHVRTR